ncbi:MAG TPA: YtxH domain-containing protein [Gemmatimonadales bacterium]|nr:YtxH domain-containing protein [Gemmatimonadales bacterium]
MAKKNNRGLVVIERGGSGSGVLWLLLGGAIGAGLGLLLAPHSGKKSRELLGDRLKSLKASAEETLEELSEEEEDQEELLEDDEASPAGTEAPEQDEDNQAEPEPRRSTPTARSELEQRLARARARRHRALVEEDEEPVA